MNSFYGGKEGRSYAIIEHFNNTTEMINAFKNGAGYTNVSYGEYVIIDTVSRDKNPDHEDNGKIFRRGIDYTNDMGGAIYVGQIQGPRGKMAPVTLMNIADFNNIQQSSVIQGQEGLLQQPTETYSIVGSGDNTTVNKIKIGYKNYRDTENNSNIKSAIGIDVPIPVVRFSAEIVQPTATTFSHTDVAGNLSTANIDFSNPIHQAPLSANLSTSGVAYYDYKLAIPKPVSNISVSASGTNKGLQLEYDTVANSSSSRVTLDLSTAVKVVDGLRSANNSDIFEYHLSGQSGWHLLGNPNGQFHIYAHYNQSNPSDNSSTFSTAQDVINFLNSSGAFPYGIRIKTNENATTYDMSQAGWVISANYSTCSGLFAFDYRTYSGGTPISISDISSSSFNTTLKGWFEIQSFESGLSNNPQDIILVGEEVSTSSVSDYGQIDNNQKSGLKDRGVWFKAEEGQKWWS